MSEPEKYHKKAKLFLIFQILMFFVFFIIYAWLESVIVGVFYIIFIMSLIIWIIGIVLTLYVYNKTNSQD
ncbi:MAG: hypothetical protein GF316_03685 [Candidatus Lokiarchaeota archaeon]|nr:hypothetical protein [Candidatus Lokiarchaeota archaeon]